MSELKIYITEEELEVAISGLLFSCSVNVVSNTDLSYQERLLNLAKKLKAFKPNIKLKDVQFIKEEYYEDLISEKILNEFKSNIEITSLDSI